MSIFSAVVARSTHGRRSARHQRRRIRHVGRLEALVVRRTHAHHELELSRISAGAPLCDARDVGTEWTDEEMRRSVPMRFIVGVLLVPVSTLCTLARAFHPCVSCFLECIVTPCFDLLRHADVLARGRLAHALQLLGVVVVRSAAHQQRARRRAVLGALSVGRSGLKVWSVIVSFMGGYESYLYQFISSAEYLVLNSKSFVYPRFPRASRFMCVAQT